MDCDEIMKIRNRDNSFSAYLGIMTTEMRPGYAKGEMAVTPNLRNVIASVHGGVTYTLADTIGGAAATSHGFYVTTVSGNFNYLAPALDTEKLIAVAQEIKVGKRITVCDVKIYDDDDRLLAMGVFTYSNLGRRYGE